MPYLRTITGRLFALTIGCAPIFAAETTLPKRDYSVTPIPLHFADEEELPSPRRAGPESATELSPFQSSPSSAPELTAPTKPDPFARPGFDPFDDESFAPGSSENVKSRLVPRSIARPSQLSPGRDIQPLDTLPNMVDDGTIFDGERETIRERYPNGAVKIEREMMQDTDGNYVLDGAWRWFNDKGQLIADGDYTRDQRQGVWRRTFTVNDAPLFKAAPYNQFQPPFHSEANFAQGLLHGAWTIYDGRQRKVSEIYFENGQRHGAATWWQVRGTPVIQSTFVNGEIHGEAFVFDETGNVIRRDMYEHGWKFDRRTEKYPSGKPKEISSWLDGRYKLTNKDDWWNARIASFEVVDEPIRHGHQMTYFPNGQVQRKQEFNRGKPAGEIQYWHENGQKALAGHFNDEGKPDGEWIWWHANGLKSIAGMYAAGQPQQDWTWWNTEGKITRRGELTEELPETKIATGPQPTTLGRPRPVD